MANNFAADYVDVAERIAIFRDKYPEGSLRLANPEEPYRVLTVGDTTYVVVVACAHRTPDDPIPGVGMAQEQIPGRTPYTKGSELQNAETSAWGRAIVAALAADTKKGVASADEVRNRQAEREAPRETDKAWMTDMDARILTCTDETVLGALWREIADAFNAGRLAESDRDLLVGSWTDRKQALLQGVLA